MSDLILTSKTFFACSLGCRTNQAEMESISLKLVACGFRQYNSSTLQLSRSPALILLNTCIVTQKAEKETRQKIRELRKKYPKSFLVVLGCAVTAKEKLQITLPEANLFISNEEKSRTVDIIEQSFCSPKQILTFTHDRDESSMSYKDKYQSSGRKFIKIQDGCTGGCSFCLTQFVRGKPTSVPPEKIIEEINYWVKKGIKEVILTGINIGLWGVIASEAMYQMVLGEARQSRPSYNNSTGLLRRSTPRNDNNTITNLINNILQNTKIERISFSSIYPEMLSGEFINLVVNNPRISQYFHLSLQSGSQTVLERMNRNYSINELTDLLLFIKQKNPLFTFRADIIIGFPGETEKEFQETLEFIKKTKISFAHVFTFSSRKGTTAYEMIKLKKWHDLPESIKKERSEKIRKVVEKTREEEAKELIAKLLNCLIVRKCNSVIASEAMYQMVLGEARQPRPNYDNSTGLLRRSTPRNDIEVWEGITENGWPIKITNCELRIANYKGEILPVKIMDFKNDYLMGEILSFPTN